jgi:hypothetical protein
MAFVASVQAADKKETVSKSAVDKSKLEFKSLPQSDLIRGMTLLAARRHKEACSSFEKVFHQKDSKLRDRVTAAQFLSLQSNKDLKVLKRHQYATFVWEHIGDSIKGEKRDGLLRTLGDGYFDEMNLAAAKNWYGELSNSADPEQVDYAMYKLGWVHLNEGNATQAHKCFLSRVIRKGSKNSSLRDSLVKDLGRAWAESGGRDRLDMSSSGLSFDAKEKNLFLEGLVAGLRRIAEAGDRNRLRESVLAGPYAQDVAKVILEQGEGHLGTDCTVLDWVQSSNVRLAELPKKSLVERLNSCVRDIEKEMGKKEDWSHHDQAARLMPIYASLELSGPSRWVKALLFARTGWTKEALVEYAALTAEESVFTDNPKSAMTNSIGQAVALVKKADAKNVLPMADPLARALNQSVATGHLGLDESNPRYLLLQESLKKPGFAKAFLDAIAVEGSSLRNSLVPALLVEHLPKDVRQGKSHVIMATLGPDEVFIQRPDRDVWVGLLYERVKYMLDNGNEEYVYSILKTQAPLAPLGELVAHKALPRDDSMKLDLWAMWLAKSNTATMKPEEQLAAHNVMKALLVLKRPDAKSALALALKMEMIDELWTVWDHYEKELANETELKKHFYELTYKSYLAGTLPESKILVSKYHGTAFVSLVAKIKSANAQNLSQTIGGLGKAEEQYLPDVQDLKSLYANAVAMNRSKLRFNGRLPREIEKRIGDIKKHVERIQAKSWLHNSMAHIAKLTAIHACDGFIEDLQTLSQPKELDEASLVTWNNQLQQIVSMVQGLRGNLTTLQGGL